MNLSSNKETFSEDSNSDSDEFSNSDNYIQTLEESQKELPSILMEVTDTFRHSLRKLEINRDEGYN